MSTQLSLWQSSRPQHRDDPRLRPSRGAAMQTGVHRRPALSASELDGLAQQWEEDAHAARTKRAYRADLAAFETWCAAQGERALPASTETLRRYLMALALRGLKPSTIRRARKSIGLAHAHAALPRPDQDARIRSIEFSIGRKLGSREEGAEPLLLEQLELLLKTLRSSPRDDRDRAVLLVGWAGAFRASELCGMRMEHLRFDHEGLHVFLPQSKEDRLRRGDEVLLCPSANPDRCPLEALRTWMARVGRPTGPLFRRVHGAMIDYAPICERTIARIVQRAAADAGLSGDFSAHSLRSGYATSAKERGVSPLDIQAHGRWRASQSVARYIDVRRTPSGRKAAASVL